MPNVQYYKHIGTDEIFHFTEFGKGKFSLENGFEPYVPPKWLIKTTEPNKDKLFSWNVHLARREDMQPYEEVKVVEVEAVEVIAPAQLEEEAISATNTQEEKVEVISQGKVFKGISKRSRKRMKEKTGV